MPFLLVDGHNTCVDPHFLDYINNNNHQGKVCLGVPYATLLWQVGNSAENNKTFKSEWYCEKDKLLLWKYERGMEQVIWHYDAIPILNNLDKWQVTNKQFLTVDGDH